MIKKKKSKNFVGIDIGDKYLKLSLLSSIDDIYSVDCHTKIDVSDCVNYGRIINPQKIQEYIQSFIVEYNILKPELIFAFPNKNSDFSQTKIFKMRPLSKKDEMKSAIDLEVENIFNKIEDTNIDEKLEWETLSTNFQDHHLIYSTLYNKSIIEEYGNIMKDLKYSYSIIPKNLFLNNTIDSSGKTVLVVDIGFNNTDMIVYHDNLPITIKTSSVGGNSITNIISSLKGISYNEAENLKINNGLLIRDNSPIDYSQEEIELSDYIRTQVQMIINDVKRLSVELNAFNLSIDEIKICGGSSNIKYLPEYFGFELNCPSEKLIPIFLENNKDFDIVEQSSTYLISFSASMTAFKEPISKFSYKNKKKENDKIPIIILGISLFIMVLISSVTICGNIVADQYLKKTGDKLQVVKTDYQPFENQAKQYTSIIEQSNAKVEEANQIKNVLDNIDKIEILPIDVLTKLKTHTPKNVQIDTLSFNSGKLEIEGVVSDYMTLGYFIKELELVEEFSKIDFEYSNIYTQITSNSEKTVKNLKYKITIDYNKDVAPINQ